MIKIKGLKVTLDLSKVKDVIIINGYEDYTLEEAIDSECIWQAIAGEMIMNGKIIDVEPINIY